MESVRSALFIDFDNIYSGLKDDHGDAAARSFATKPSEWIESLSSFSASGPVRSGPVRRVLLRKCYLNPSIYGRYRSDFIHAACEVVDCPSLTRAGKSAADIHMALDIVEALAQREPPFDEFIIMSTDADFTPVLLRLRRHDRRLLVVAPSLASAAYTGVAEIVLDTDRFVTSILGMDTGEAPTTGEPPATSVTADAGALAATAARPGTPPGEDRLQELGRKLERVVLERNNVLPAHAIASAVFTTEDDFADSNWYGYWSLRRLVAELVSRVTALRISDDEENWAVVRIDEPADAEGASDEPVDFIRRQLQKANAPLLGETLALLLRTRFPQEVWFGHPSFRSFLEASLPGLGLAQEINRTHHFIYDPQRHTLPQFDPEDPDRHLIDEISDPELYEFSQRLRRLANVPALSSEVYAALFRVISQVVSEKNGGGRLSEVARAVRDRVVEEGFPVPRSAVNWVLRGLQFEGCAFDKPNDGWDPGTLAEAYRRNIQAVVENAALNLDTKQLELLEKWFGSTSREGPPEAVG